jgi:asparagine synthase (glutamine-hydrolysing)
MCGIGGFFRPQPVEPRWGAHILERINRIQHHRGPDGEGTWLDASAGVGLAHRRLSIIDLATGAQPMRAPNGNVITYNGEIYNYLELRAELGPENFRTTSDTEVILRAYERWGEACVDRLRGMFAFALWDAARGELFVARDRFGIKPLYYAVCRDTFYFASEAKALTGLLDRVETDLKALHDYFCFQFCLGAKTLFSGISQVEPAHCGYVGRDLRPHLHRYWEVRYEIDWDHTDKYFIDHVRHHLVDSVGLHLRSDVEVGAYVSGGVDSSLIASMARDQRNDARFQAFTGKFSLSQSFDESRYARILAQEKRMRLHEIDISEQDFVDNIAAVIFHLDQPIAGPGSFPQYMVSRLVRDHIKVVLGGQGGDEIFGGYARYLLAYFEQCIKGAIDGTMQSGHFVVTYESIIPNLTTLRTYKPLIQEFWSQGIFDERDKRYFRLINRSNTFGDIIDWSIFDGPSSYEEFRQIYWGENVGKESYFDSMTHFDFKTLLPALLQVEDRMSMAHGIESRVPFLDHVLVEFAATVPSSVKFQNGELKRLLRASFSDKLPRDIVERKDKMGFPVPLQVWLKQPGAAREFVLDTFRSQRSRTRPYLKSELDIEAMVATESVFGRNLWALLSLELWQQQFHDQHPERQERI